MNQHPLSSAFPSMTSEEINLLANDILKNGQREPGVIFEDMVIDGWHRYQACQISNVEFISVPLPEGSDPVAFVKSRNLHRRHLTPSQRAAAVVACSEWHSQGRPEKSVHVNTFKKLTNAEMAADADVSVMTIRRAKVATNAGLIDDVRDGKITVNEAVERVKEKSPVPVFAPVRVVPEPEIVIPPCPTEESDIGALREEIDQLKITLKETLSDNEMMGRVFDADDRISAAMHEAKRQKAIAENAERTLMAKNGEYIERARAVTHWKNRAEKAEKELAKLKDKS